MSNSDTAHPPTIRVLMVTPFPESGGRIVGGVAGVAYYLCQGLMALQGVEVDVLVPACVIEKPITKDFDGLKVTYLPDVKSSLAERVFLRGSALKVQQHVEAGQYDIVHIQAAPEWGQCLRIPAVVTLHGMLEQDMLFRSNRSLVRKILWPLVRLREQIKRSRIDNLILISPYVSRSVGWAFRGRAWSIENPVKEGYFSIIPKPKRDSLLYAGIVCPRKNVERLIQAIALVREKNPNVHLNIAGSLEDSHYAERCKAEVQRLGLEGNIDFLGSITLDDMQQRLSSTQLMVLCSLQETAPLSIGEAMAAGVPVVASNICGIPNMVEAGVTGCLVDPLDVEDIARGILEGLALDREAAGQRSKQLARERFSVEVVALATVEVYRELLKS